MMIGVSLFILIWVIAAMVIGWVDSIQVDIMIELKYLSNPWFNIGVSFQEHPQEDHVQQELIIGLFFINFVIVFFKEIEA